MSRYLVQLARETRSRLRPPSALRLAPRAPAVYQEIHEERIVDSAPAAVELAPRVSPHSSVEQAPAPPRNPETIQAPIPPPVRLSPQPGTYRTAPPAREPSAEPARSFDTVQRPIAPPLVEPMPTPRPAARENPTRDEPPPAAKPERRRTAQEPSWREIDREILETTTNSTSFLLEDRPAVPGRSSAEFAIPEPVRAWLRPDRRPAPEATQRPLSAPAAVPQPATQAVIDVTIGKVEVTIESEPHPPLVAARRPAPRVTPPARSAPPPATGRLARQYLDR